MPVLPGPAPPDRRACFTDDEAFATVVSEPDSSTGWFNVEYDDGRRTLMNDERVIPAAQAERLHGLRDERNAR
ncbi:MAG: hypothetical protein ACRDHS_04450 [Actinomycetota bacterium]